MDQSAYDSAPFRAEVFDPEITIMRAPKMLFQPTASGTVPASMPSNSSGVVMGGGINSVPMHVGPYYNNQPGVMEPTAQVKPPQQPYQIKSSVQDRLNRDNWLAQNHNTVHNYDYSTSQTSTMPVLHQSPQSLEARLHLNINPNYYPENMLIPNSSYTQPTGTSSNLDSTQYHCQKTELPCASNSYERQNKESYEKEYYTSSNVDKELHASSTKVDDLAALSYLQMAIQCLDENPGQFDLFAKELNTILEDKADNNYVLSVAMEDIFVEALEKVNFRYMGAKLYILLQKLNPNSNSVFNQLLQRKLDHHREEIRNMVDSEKYKKTCATVLFLAELYMQMHSEKFDVNLIATDIVYFLQMLIGREEMENIRCVCLCLKLVGYDLSRDNLMSLNINGILEKLAKIDENNPGTYPIIGSVIKLQKNNWGRDISSEIDDVTKALSTSSILNKESVPPYGLDVDEPVFYGPDGYQISAEECEFLTQHVEETEFQNPNNYDIIDCIDPEADPETREHYLSFLKDNK